MTLTIGERKERYYKLVLDKANKMYSSWKTERITSKKLVAQANGYAFDNRLKTDAVYRFYAFAFTVALGIRFENRYRTFLRRLFLLFAYIREEDALRRLRNVFGFDDCVDLREMVELEAEKIIIIFSQKQTDESTGGGRRAELVDITFDEELNNFFEECVKEEEQKNLANDSVEDEFEQVDVHDKPLPVKSEENQREKISVVELETRETVGERKKETNSPTKIEQTEKQTTKPLETGVAKNENIEKTVANTSILAEAMILAQESEKDLPSPFPVFRENTEDKTVAMGKTDSISEKEIHESKVERENSENFDKDMHIETHAEQSPFPVFHREEGPEIKSSETTVEKEIRISEEKTPHTQLGISETKTLHTQLGIAEEKTIYFPPNSSEENKARIELNVTMSQDEIHAITEQLRVSASIEMERVEQEWREKISIDNGNNEIKTSIRETKNSSNTSVIQPAQKK